jgi:hypothetical protein
MPEGLLAMFLPGRMTHSCQRYLEATKKREAFYLRKINKSTIDISKPQKLSHKIGEFKIQHQFFVVVVNEFTAYLTVKGQICEKRAKA